MLSSDKMAVRSGPAGPVMAGLNFRQIMKNGRTKFSAENK